MKNYIYDNNTKEIKKLINVNEVEYMKMQTEIDYLRQELVIKNKYIEVLERRMHESTTKDQRGSCMV